LNNDSPQLVMIGEVVGAHGLAGAVKVRATTDDVEQFAPWQKIQLQRGDNSLGEHVIEQLQIANKGLLIKFQEVNDRNRAELLRGAQLLIPREECLPAEADQFFHYEIIGLPVFLPNGDPLGEIVGVERYPANDVWVIRSGGVDKLIPAIDSVVQKVDLPNRRVIINPLPGLLED
jgi:16S rRNA processing protein RimM